MKKMDIFGKIRSSIRKMSFFKRTIASLALAFFAVLGFAVLYEAAYYWMAAHSGWVVAAGLIGSQVILYKEDFVKLASGAKTAGKQAAPKQAAASGPQGAAQAQPVDLEKAAEELGKDFAAVDGESDDDEAPESFSD